MAKVKTSRANAAVTSGSTSAIDPIETEDDLKQAIIRLLSDLPLSISPPMVAAAMGEALAAFLEEEMS